MTSPGLSATVMTSGLHDVMDGSKSLPQPLAHEIALLIGLGRMRRNKYTHNIVLFMKGEHDSTVEEKKRALLITYQSKCMFVWLFLSVFTTVCVSMCPGMYTSLLIWTFECISGPLQHTMLSIQISNTDLKGNE